MHATRPALGLALAALATLATPPTAAETAAPVPSYQEALEAYQAARAKRDGPGLTAEDRRVMAEAAAELERTLPEPGLSVGETAPDFTLPDANGEPVTLSEHLARGPVVLTFYRGAWCPYCNLQLRGLQATLPRIRALGASLVAVTPQRPDRSLEQVREDGYPFPILSDLDSSVMQAYRLHFRVPAQLRELYIRKLGLDLAAYNGPGRHELPVPGTFVIDRTATVRAAFADTDYRQRMEPAAILAALRDLQADPPGTDAPGSAAGGAP